MDGYRVDGCLDRWMQSWMEAGRMEAELEGYRMDECMDEWLHGYRDGRMHGYMIGWHP